jgi:hypothetical protein
LKSQFVYEPQVRQLVAGELAYKDTTGYFGVYLNKPAWWVCRLSTESRVSWIGFPASFEEMGLTPPAGFEVLPPHPHAKSRLRINDVHDLLNLAQSILASIRWVMAEHKSSGS